MACTGAYLFEGVSKLQDCISDASNIPGSIVQKRDFLLPRAGRLHCVPTIEAPALAVTG